jgi:hypothetical protein
MSDIFNESSHKQDIISILKGVREADRSDNTDNMVAYIMPAQSKVIPDDLKTFTATDLSRHAKTLNLPIFRPRTIPEMTQVNLSGKINPVLIEVSVGKEGAKELFRSLPMGQAERLPKYIPTYRIIPNNVKLYRQIWFQFVKLNQETRNVYNPLMQKLYVAMRDTSMCSGTWKGQLHRLKAGYDGKLGRNGLNVCKNLVDSLNHLCRDGQTVYEKYSEIMEDYMPINLSKRHKADEIVTFPGLFKRPSFLAGIVVTEDEEGNQEEEVWSFLPRIGTDKMAGPPFPFKYKDQVILESYAIADSFLGEISQNLAKSFNQNTSTMGKPSNKTPEALKDMQDTMQAYWFLGSSYMFPKTERYDWAKVLKGEKTRNIFAQPFPTFILQSAIMDPVLDYAPNFLIDDRIPSMYGVSFYHGGMDKTIRLLTEPGRTVILVYADNFYVSKWNKDTKCHSYYSIDLVKGESQTSPRDLSAMNYYLLTRGHIDTKNRPRFNMSWAYTGTNLLPHMQSDCVALLGSLQFKVPGMASGIKITYCGNAGRSSIFAWHWKRGVKYAPYDIEPECTPNSESWVKLCEFVGINWLVEQEIPNLEAELDECRRMAPKTGLMQTEESETTKHLGKLVELDLLGYAATYSNLMAKWIPVLATDRLVAALVAPQRDAEAPLRIDAGKVNIAITKGISTDMYKLVMAETYRMAGGWFHQPIDEALKVMAKDARTKLMADGLMNDGPMLEALKLTEFADQLTPDDVRELLPRGMTATDLINVNTDKMTTEDSRDRLKSDYYEEFKDVNEMRKETSDNKTFDTNKVWNNRISTLLLNKIEDWAKNKHLIDLKQPQVEVSDEVIAEMKKNNFYREALAEFYSISKFMGSTGDEVVNQPKTFKHKNVTPEEIANPAGVKGNKIKASSITSSTAHLLSGQRQITHDKVLKPAVENASFLSEVTLIAPQPLNKIKGRGVLVKLTADEWLAKDIDRLKITEEQLKLVEQYRKAGEDEKLELRQTHSIDPQAFKDFERVIGDTSNRGGTQAQKLKNLRFTYGPMFNTIERSHDTGAYYALRKNLVNMHYMFTSGETAAVRELAVTEQDTAVLSDMKKKHISEAQDTVRNLAKTLDKVKKDSKDRKLALIPLDTLRLMAVERQEAFVDYYEQIRDSEIGWAKVFFKTIKDKLGQDYETVLKAIRSSPANTS